jgi:amino acid adenylation domain-containing protein
MSRKNVEDLYPLSPLQQGLLFHTLYAPASGVYVEQLNCTLGGELNFDAFGRAWQQTIDRHPILRTAFVWEGLDEPVQVVRRSVRLPFTREDWRALPAAEQQERLRAYLKADLRQGFDLSKAPLMRIALLQLAEDSYQFVWSYHHLMLDGWCVPLVLREVFAFYEAFSRGESYAPQRPRPYRDYIAWLRRQDLRKAEAFWRQTLKGFHAPTPLPTVRAFDAADGEAAQQEEEYGEQEISLASDTTAALQTLARSQGLTLNTLVQGAWALLLSRYSGERDVVFGVTVSGRPAELAGVESMVGLFINTLPLRVEIEGGQELLPWLKSLQEQQTELRQYEYSPLVQVQGWSDAPRGLPLFNSLLVFENYPVDASFRQQLAQLSVSNIRKVERTNYPLNLLAVPGAQLLLRFSYDRRRFDAAAIKRMLGHLRTALENFAAHPSQRLDTVPLLTQAERQQLLFEWNDTARDYPPRVCLHELFEAQVERTPDAVAVVFEDERLSYRELNRRANALAERLRASGVGAESRVGVCAERSSEMVVALIGVLKAGGAYVPLEPTYPAERLSYMLADAEVSVLLTQERLLETLPPHDAEVICLDRDWKEIDGLSAQNMPSGASAHNAAYVIYTSGSTGRPKGVVNTHGGICNRLLWMQDEYALTGDDRVLQKTPYSFDVSVWEFFWPLIAGAQLVVARPGGHQDSAYLVRLIAREAVTTLHFVPSMLSVFLAEPELEECRSLRRVICSGEALTKELQERFFARLPAELHNLYGPTEAAVDVSYWACQRDDGERLAVPIGRPIANIQLYVLDAELQPVPVGVAGELYIAGVGLARGYLNRPELTAEKFIANPFGAAAGARMYRTGDAARYLEGGEIEFLGRLDQQVKLRGFRIELGEIESVLAEHSEVGECVVVARDDARGGDRRIVAYFVPAGETPPTTGALRGFLKEKLPEYMIPSAFVALQAFPLTPNGKLDRRALPAPEQAETTRDVRGEGTRNPLEEVIAGIWAEVLGLERVGLDDNFFEAGGHSLLALRVVSRLRSTLKIEVPVRELFDAPTVASFTERIETLRHEETGAPSIPLVPDTTNAERPLSFAQQRLWFLDQLEPESAAYNIPAAVRLSGALDVSALERSFKEVVRRHEILRATFPAMQGQPRQVVAPEAQVNLRVEDLQHLPEDAREAEIQRRAAEEAARPFSLSAGALFRVVLLKAGAREHVLLLTMHHIISDGWSIGILIREMAALYEAFTQGQPSPLAELPIQYADFARWQRRTLTGDLFDKQLAYWKARLGDAPPKLELPYKRHRPHGEAARTAATTARRSATYRFTLQQPLASALKSLSRREGTTLFMTLMAAYKTLLHHYTGATDITVGSPVANRNRAEVENLIGFFVNILILRSDLSGNPTFRELLARERETTLGAYAHQDVPFEKLVEELPDARGTGHVPLHQVVFALQNFSLPPLALPELTLSQLDLEGQTAKNELLLFMNETEHGLEAIVQYDADLFDASTVRRMFEHFEELLNAFAADPDRRIRSLNLFAREMASALALPAARVGRIAPLTPTQRDLYLAHLINPDTTIYSDGVSVALGTNLDVAAWQKAVALVFDNTDAARTRFFSYRGEPYQFVDLEYPVPFEFVDLTDARGDATAAGDFARIVREKIKVKYDLDGGALLNNLLFRDAGGQYVAAVAWYHILFDAYSLKLYLESIVKTYLALVAGREPETDGRNSFYDYVGDSLARFDGKETGEFWSNKLSRVAPLAFPKGTEGAARQSIARRLAVAPEHLARIRAFCDARDYSVPAYFRALYAILLARSASATDDFVFYELIGSRPREHADTIGCFYQVLPTLVPAHLLAAATPISAWFDYVRHYRSGLGAMQNISVFQQTRIMKDERLKFFYNFYNFSSLEIEGEKKTISHYKSFPDDEVHFIVDDLQDAFELAFYYHASAFPDPHLLERILSLSEQVLDGAEVLRTLDPLLPAERARLHGEWNNTAREYPTASSASLHQLFEAQVECTPDATAVVFKDERVSYAELNRRANRLAQRLRAAGVRAEMRVGILAERSVEMVVGLLGILKAGGAYVPIDASYPAERVRFILEDAAVKVLLAQERLLDLLPAHEAEVIRLDVDWGAVDEHDAENAPVAVSPHNAAYVIYTSGSTGRPKGVVNTHGGICNRLLWMQDEYALTCDDRVLQKTPYSFDVSVWEFFWPLITGAQLIIAEPGGHQDAAYLVRLVAEQKITITHFVPAMLRVFLEQRGVEACASLRDVICSGEALPYELQERFFARLPLARLHNLYGPTEAAVDVTYWACERGSVERIVPIGRPIANTQIHVLDRDLRPVPPGLAGELYIGGSGLARVYHRRPDLTAERFTPDPFARAPGARLYRTGDLARRLANGAIEYLGRTDFQVKVRGFRIELGEIEAALMNHPAIGEAVVVAKGDAELERHLVAYYTVASAAETQPAEAVLRAHLKETLPDFMLPSAFVALDALPLTPNGKVDRRALPEPQQESETPEREVILARTPVEQTLADIWGEVLKRERVSVYDNFFEVGGHSLLATQVVARASEAFDIELPLRSLFESPTLAGLAERIESALAAHGDAGKRLPPILPVDRSVELPLSFAQQRLWFLDQFEPGNPFYNVPGAVRLYGALDVAALEQSINEVVRRHEILRTTFTSAHGQPRQVIAPALKLTLAPENLQALAEAERQAEVRRLAAEEARRPFDLAASPLVRARLLQVDEEDHVLLFTMHHIISDGWSVNILFREVAALYEAFTRGEPSPLPELPIQYADFAAWQRGWLRGDQLEEQLGYWREQLRHAPALLELPTDRPRPPIQTYRGATARFALTKELSEELQRLSRRERATLFMTLLAAFQALLHRYSGAKDVVVGSPIAGRHRTELEPLIGFFVNTLVLRATFDDDPTFAELLSRVREASLGAYAHQDVPFEKLVEELQPAREMSHTPLFQVMFALQNEATEATRLPGLELMPLEVESGVAKFDLTLGMNEADEGLAGLIEYNTDLFEDETIERMIAHLTTLLEGIVADPQRRVSELPLMTGGERRQVVSEWNETGREYARGERVHEMFERRAEAEPEAVAIVCEGKEWTFGEVNARANKLAHYLRQRGVGAEKLVGVLMERSAEMFIGLLGVLKAGGAYLPLDPTYPKERLAFILQDAHITLLLTEDDLRQTTFEHAARVVCVDAERDEVARESVDNPGGDASADNLVYVIYTSGSTGRPKGVCVPHRALANHARAMAEHYGLQPADRVLQFASMSFDVAAEELFATWASGAAVVVMPPDDYLLQTFLRLIEEQQISVVNLSASYWYEWVAALSRREATLPPSLRLVVTGSEKVSTAQLATWQALAGERVRWINAYGPTEATITTTIFEPQGELKYQGVGSVPIGRPVNNARVYLLDKKLQPLPVGIAGELHIGGRGVARGYLNRAELTAEKFIPDPFSTEAGARLYRTGDWARYLPDGEIEFLRRIDQQVKVRGFRIELGEIESALAAHAGVHETAVVLREDAQEDKRIVAYVVPKREGDAAHNLSAEGLRAYLAERVPAYMLPSAFVLLDEMPLTPSGKVDVRALPAPETLRPEMNASFALPRSPVEEVLAGIFGEVLKLERVGTDDNFFALGGHSLLATQVVARAREVFRVELPLRALFESPTVAGLAAQVEALDASTQTANAPPPLRPVPRDGELPLSFIQQRFWFLHQLMPESSAYNIPTAVRLKGALDVSALERSFNEVVRRHEILRTSFVSNGGRPEQLIASELKLELPLIDLSGRPPEEREAEAHRLAAEEAQRPFDLARAPLIRTALLRLDAHEFILLFTMHHIVSDGWSSGVLIRDLTAIYEAYAAGLPSPLAELPIQFADFAHWQREWLQGEVLEHRLSYWRKQFGDGLPVLNLPTDKPRPPVPTDNGAIQTLVLPAQLSAAIESLGQRESVTLFMLLLAAFKVLLHRYTGQEDILVGSSIANRNHVETEGLIGLLINTLILRTDLSGDPAFDELLARVREASLGAYAHQDLPFEQLLEELRADFDAGAGNAPVFQVAFQLQNFSMPTLELKDITLSPFDVEGHTAKFDLSLSVIETPDGLVASLEYNTDLFETATIKRMLDHYRTLLEGIVADPSRRISALPLLSEAERRQLLSEWNPAFESDAPASCLHRLFEAQAKRRPDATALVFEDKLLTYGELNRRANKLAHYLRGRGVGADTLVSICVERSVEMLVGILGILKAGGAYVPLDPAYPKERLAFILEDTQARLLLTQQRLVETLPAHDAEVVLLDAHWPEIANTSSDENPAGAATADELAYVIYTSGSTGRPKGVLVTHENVARLLEATQAHFEFDESDVWTLFHSYAFDFSVWEIWGALAHGGKLVIVPYWVSRSAEAFRRLLASEGVTVLNQTPSAFRQLAAADESADGSVDLKLRLVIFGGEALELQSLRSWFERHGDRRPQLVNMFGITETTVHVTYRPLTVADLELASSSRIGRPLECLQVYLLDGRGQLVPVGVPAEVCVGGTGVARGYLNRAELTAERFVPHPFTSSPGARLYRSGDLARRLPNGDMEYLGRIDNQVKVRGFRIELGEIESALAEHEGVRECTVVATNDAGGETKLLAYFVGGGRQQPAPSTTELREFLQEKLPEHMIPAAFIVLDAMPLTPNGKIDRRALPAPGQMRPQLGREFVAPRTPVEQELAKIWRELLGVEEVGIYDDFFELGGHSLLLTQLASWIRKDFQVEVPLRVLFDTPTITDMTRAILARQVEQETQTDLAEMLSQLKQLSPHEVKAMLEKMGGSS